MPHSLSIPLPPPFLPPLPHYSPSNFIPLTLFTPFFPSSLSLPPPLPPPGPLQALGKEISKILQQRNLKATGELHLAGTDKTIPFGTEDDTRAAVVMAAQVATPPH